MSSRRAICSARLRGAGPLLLLPDASDASEFEKDLVQDGRMLVATKKETDGRRDETE